MVKMGAIPIHVREGASKDFTLHLISNAFKTTSEQGGRTWQTFVGGKNGHENFRQARIYNFRVVFACNRKFENFTQ